MRLPASSQGVRQLLGDVSLFAALSTDELDVLAPLFEQVALTPVEAVIRQGEAGDAMYVLAEGELLVTVGDSPVDRLSAGAVVGQMALLTSPERSATVTEVLIDGGVMNNLPVELVRDFLGSATVIASNAYGGRTGGSAMSFGDDVSGWSVLRAKLLPFGRRVAAPSLFGTLMRSTSLASKSVMEEAWRHADLVVTYPSSQVSALDFDHYAETIEIGRWHATEALDDWLAGAAPRLEVDGASETNGPSDSAVD